MNNNGRCTTRPKKIRPTKPKDRTTTDQTTIEVCRMMTDQASMNDQSTKKLEDWMTRDMTTM
jgi:hypothetical protein